MSEAETAPDTDESAEDTSEEDGLPDLVPGFKYRQPGNSRYFEILRDGADIEEWGWTGDFLVAVYRIVRKESGEENLDLGDMEVRVRGSCGRVSKEKLKERLLDETYEVGHGSMTDRIEETVDRSGRRG